MADFDLNGTLYPIIAGVVELMPSFLALIIAVVPIAGFKSILNPDHKSELKMWFAGGAHHHDVCGWFHHQVLGPDRKDDEFLILKPPVGLLSTGTF